MEPPSKFDANLVRDEKLKVIQSLKKIDNLEDISIGQYGSETLKKRDKMRKDGFYEAADEIRINLEKENIIIEDSQQGAKWRRKR